MSASQRFAVVILIAFAQTGLAQAADDPERVDELEKRIEELESASAAEATASSNANWTRYIRLGGSANTGVFGGDRHSEFDHDSFLIWDVRFFVDALLGDTVRLGDQTIFRNIGFTFEWDLVRLGDLDNRVGELYVDFQGFLGQDALNFQVGRFQLPVGESYLRYSRGYADKPFVSNTIGGPWWWDEGIRVYGSFLEGRAGYVGAVSDGTTSFNTDPTSDKLFSLKLYGRPTSWLYLSASGLRTGKLGSNSSPASGALWLGEAWGRAYGSRSDVDNYQDGMIVPDAPNRIHDSWFAGADAVIECEDKFRIWLAYGRYAIDAAGEPGYDRHLHYWVAEAILRGAWAAPVLRPFYLGGRVNALGTYDDDKGYLLDSRDSDSLGYNAKSLTDYSAVLGWEITRHVRLRVEYTRREITLVDGVSDAIRDAGRDRDVYAIEIGGSF